MLVTFIFHLTYERNKKVFRVLKDFNGNATLGFSSSQKLPLNHWVQNAVNNASRLDQSGQKGRIL